MKKIFWLTLFQTFMVIHAQEKISVSETLVGINTIDGNTVSVKLFFDLDEGYRHRTSVFFRNNPNLSYRINSISQQEAVSDATANDALAGNTFIGFRFEAGSKLMDRIKSGNADYFIEINDTIRIELINDSLNRTVTYVLTPDQVKENTRNKLILSEEEINEIIQSMGGEINMVSNHIDFGLIPGEESASGRTEYAVNYSYRSGYSFLKNIPVYFQSSGLLSTNPRDSLNFIRIFPVGFSLMKNHHEISGQAGMEANQVFTQYRITADVHWQGLIPNLINLTYGENRLRLKPVLEAGIKLYQEIENDRSGESNKNVLSGIAYAQVYYYIPVLKLYSIIIAGNTFYDFNKDRNPGKELGYLYSITAGIEIPNSGIKTIFKYANGANDISFANTSTFMIGFMADLFMDTMK